MTPSPDDIKALRATYGLTQSEWHTLVGRLSSRDAYRLERMTSRLSALPVTASLPSLSIRNKLSLPSAVNPLSSIVSVAPPRSTEPVTET